MPHTVTLDRAGNVWYTGNNNATIGKLDPDTGEVTGDRRLSWHVEDDESARRLD